MFKKVCFSSEMNRKIKVFGDSHSIVFTFMDNVAENWLGFNTNLPVTMYRFSREGLDLEQAPILVGNGHEKYPVEPGDTIVYSYGFIDVNHRLPKFCDKNTDIDELIKPLVIGYIDQIKKNEMKFLVNSVVLCVLPPPNINLSEYSGTDPVLRVALTERMNVLLKQECKRKNVLFMDVSKYVTDTNGHISDKVSSDGIHVNKENVSIIDAGLTQCLNSMPKLGFIVLTHARLPEHTESLINCVTSIRKHYPDQIANPIVLLDDSSPIPVPNSVLDIPGLKRVLVPDRASAEAAPFKYYLHNRFCEKMVFLHDSMILLKPLENTDNENISFLWHFTNHRVHWSEITEPITAYNTIHDIVTHDDLINHLVKKYMCKNKDFSDYFNRIYYQKNLWVGCFGAMCLISHEFLVKMQDKTDLLSFLNIVDNRRYRCALESILSIAAQYTLGRAIEGSLDGLYYDGNYHNGFITDTFHKNVFLRI